jgi:dephospho-CoA kinase
MRPSSNRGGIVRKIGVTGGIATGKSSVTGILKGLGFEVVDADVLAREAVMPGSPGILDIAEKFGDDMVSESGELDRAKLGNAVFGNPEKLSLLNSILHPVIRRMAEERFADMEMSGWKVAFFDCPLLIEAGFEGMVDDVWLVYSDPRTQLERIMERDGISVESAKKRIGSQIPIDEKLSLADRVIKNTLSLEDLEQRVLELLREEGLIRDK